MKSRILLLLSSTLLLFAGCGNRPAGSSDGNTTQISYSVSKIWDSGKHCAFTSMVKYRGRYYVAFREAESHIFDADGEARGNVCIIVSENGRDWSLAARMAREGYDLRDPKLSVSPDGKLLVSIGGSIYRSKQLVGRNPLYSVSEDGVNFSELATASIECSCLSGNDWLWRVSWIGGKAYGIIYCADNVSPRMGGTTKIALVKSDDGVNFTEVKVFDLDGYPNETTLRELPDGRMAMLVRRESGDKQGVWGVSEPPFTEWTLNEIGCQLGGPDFVVTGENEVIAGTRSYLIPGKYKTILLKGSFDGSFEEVCVLPSGGDTSYPGMLVEGDELWVSYYSAHETAKPAIYLARIPLTSL